MKYLALALILSGLPNLAIGACRHALALGLDVSGSVDAEEYRLQLDGVAIALQSDAVSEVLFGAGAAPIRIAVFEWSGPSDQTLILSWTTLADPKTRDMAAERLRSHQRSAASQTTAIGPAMDFGAALLATQDDCWRQTLDLSGDGEANTGTRPQDTMITRQNLIINGLVIGSGDQDAGDFRFADIKELSTYYQTYVTRGPGAFVETAIGFEEYASAMERKLVRELQSIAIGALPKGQ